MIFNTVPRLFTLPVYGLDISDLSYKYLCLEQIHGGIRIADFGEGEMPQGIVQNGEIRDREKLIKILKVLFAQRHIRYVALSLPDEKGFVRSLKLSTAAMQKEEIGEALSLQLEEHIPLPPAEVSFDFTLVGEDNNHYDVVLRAFPRALIEDYCAIIVEAGALPVLVEPELSAIVRAIIPEHFAKSAMLLDWGKSRTSFAVVNRDTIHFSSTIVVGGDSLTEAIAKQLKISPAEAEVLKKTKAHMALDTKTLHQDEVLQAMIPITSVIREEAEKYVQYWRGHSEDKASPTQIYLTGGDAHLAGFAEYLSQELGIPAAMANSWGRVHFPDRYLPTLSWKDSLRYACAIGLSLKAFDDGGFI